MANEKEKGKEPHIPRWNPETRSDKNRKKDREEKEKAARAKGEPLPPAPEPPAAAAETGEPLPYAPDAFDLERVRCACGRTTLALCMVDVRGVPAAIRGDAEEVCDGCWTAWVREEKLSRAELALLQGAPPEVVRHIKEHGHPHLP